MSVRGSTDLLLYMSILPLSCHVILAMHVMSLQNVGGHKQKIYHRVSFSFSCLFHHKAATHLYHQQGYSCYSQVCSFMVKRILHINFIKYSPSIQQHLTQAIYVSPENGKKTSNNIIMKLWLHRQFSPGKHDYVMAFVLKNNYFLLLYHQ